MNMVFDDIDYAVADGVATLTLNRPERMNSLHAAMHLEVRSALDAVAAAAATGAVRVLVLTGAGRGFCAGQDLAAEEARFDAAGNPPDLGQVVRDYYQPLILQLQALPVPTVAAVNGVAAGAGASIALACDLVVATASASFIQAFAKIGLIPDTGGTWFLPRRVGMARAMGMALLGDKLSATEAQAQGLIWSVVADAAFAPSVKALAAQLAAAPTQALVHIRHVMRASLGHDLTTQLGLEASVMTELGRSADFREGVMAFTEKRPAVFKGV
ncbi:MAG: 2-(1,2-epoxy-1,2-dihydrophenyl)acetyl-CoA isomerase [Neisseriaceae bacterium]|nr:2-(1,2-epoxy-1,2-dihydrophenyl)acetyl-CoA isomerase [Neisseriaceae bacterium]